MPRRNNLFPLLILFVVLAPFLLGFLGGLYWLFDLFNHFRIQFTALVFLGVLLLSLLRRWKYAFLASIFFLYGLSTILPYYSVKSFNVPKSERTDILKVMHANIYTFNPEHEKILSLVRKENPDVVVLLEVGRDWFGALSKGMDKQYELAEAVIRDDHFGMAVYTKLPVLEKEKFFFGEESRIPSFRLVLDFEGKKIAVWSLHPYPPKSRQLWKMRNRQLKQMGLRLQKEKLPALVVADLNTSPWSQAFELIKTYKLFDSSLGFGLKLTWYAAWPEFLRVPIDYILHTKTFKVMNHRILPDIGSDHFPIIAEVVLK